jgi:hypothetical protein
MTIFVVNEINPEFIVSGNNWQYELSRLSGLTSGRGRTNGSMQNM